MKKGIVAGAILSAVFAAALAVAETKAEVKPGPSGGWGLDGAYSALFKPNTTGTITGEIERVSTVILMKGMAPGEVVWLKTEKGSIPVHLGPIWYLAHQEIILKPKDKIEVKGSRIPFNGRDAVMATEVKRGDDRLLLRNEKGFPLWVASRRPD